MTFRIDLIRKAPNAACLNPILMAMKPFLIPNRLLLMGICRHPLRPLQLAEILAVCRHYTV